MNKIIFLSLFFIGVCSYHPFAQITITGTLINNENKKPISSASVFLSNATIGTKTANDGTFRLHVITPGKYRLVIICLGFKTYYQYINLSNGTVDLHNIELLVKTALLKEVEIGSPVSNDIWLRNYRWFKEEFLGRTSFASYCTILNPKVLDLRFNNKTRVLTASTDEFLEIENKALGYKVKYLLTSFVKDFKNLTVHYDGSPLFEDMVGTPAQQKRWKKNRLEAYGNSEMHFLRATLSNRLEVEGFRVYKLARIANPNRPPDSLINRKIILFKKLTQNDSKYADSLTAWIEKSNYPRIVQNLMQKKLRTVDFLKTTDQPRLYALHRDTSAFYITYNKKLRFPTVRNSFNYNLDDNDNSGTTIINFIDTYYLLFDDRGWITNPNNINYNGAWSQNRVASLLPIDYEPPALETMVVN